MSVIAPVLLLLLVAPVVFAVSAKRLAGFIPLPGKINLGLIGLLLLVLPIAQLYIRLSPFGFDEHGVTVLPFALEILFSVVLYGALLGSTILSVVNLARLNHYIRLAGRRSRVERFGGTSGMG
jgi:hypothetical protein